MKNLRKIKWVLLPITMMSVLGLIDMILPKAIFLQFLHNLVLLFDNCLGWFFYYLDFVVPFEVDVSRFERYLMAIINSFFIPVSIEAIFITLRKSTAGMLVRMFWLFPTAMIALAAILQAQYLILTPEFLPALSDLTVILLTVIILLGGLINVYIYFRRYFYAVMILFMLILMLEFLRLAPKPVSTFFEGLNTKIVHILEANPIPEE